MTQGPSGAVPPSTTMTVTSRAVEAGPGRVWVVVWGLGGSLLVRVRASSLLKLCLCPAHLGLPHPRSRLPPAMVAPLFAASQGRDTVRASDRAQDRGPASARRSREDSRSRSELRGGADTAEIYRRLREVEETQTVTGQLVVVHDNRLRELGTLFRALLVPEGSSFTKAMDGVDTEWKGLNKAYKERRRNGGDTERLGNKHLKLGLQLLEELNQDPATNESVREFLVKRWEGKDTRTPEFLGPDVRIVKWRRTRDGRHGVLEFKLTEALAVVEEEIVRVLTEKHGATLCSGPDSRGRRVRDLEDRLEGTWDTGARGSGRR